MSCAATVWLKEIKCLCAVNDILTNNQPLCCPVGNWLSLQVPLCYFFFFKESRKRAGNYGHGIWQSCQPDSNLLCPFEHHTVTQCVRKQTVGTLSGRPYLIFSSCFFGCSRLSGLVWLKHTATGANALIVWFICISVIAAILFTRSRSAFRQTLMRFSGIVYATRT